jgi:hypothetical protein
MGDTNPNYGTQPPPGEPFDDDRCPGCWALPNEECICGEPEEDDTDDYRY